jgi:hypothetical protein
LRVRTVPPNAHVRLDGREQSNPVDLELDRDPNAHLIQIDADGYQPQETRVSLDQDRELSLTLNRAKSSRKWKLITDYPQ